ncbi:MAG: hypothetical protein IPO83_10825 [Chitinophagaceae bacterium]|nr:hypothetical protein [Chitinophagaceae bacterium]
MEKIKTAIELKRKIRELEFRRVEKEELIKDHVGSLINYIKPVNVLKRSVVNSSIVQSAFSGKSLPASLLQMGGAFLLKKVFKNRARAKSVE